MEIMQVVGWDIRECFLSGNLMGPRWYYHREEVGHVLVSRLQARQNVCQKAKIFGDYPRSSFGVLMMPLLIEDPSAFRLGAQQYHEGFLNACSKRKQFSSPKRIVELWRETRSSPLICKSFSNNWESVS